MAIKVIPFKDRLKVATHLILLGMKNYPCDSILGNIDESMLFLHHVTGDDAFSKWPPRSTSTKVNVPPGLISISATALVGQF